MVLSILAKDYLAYQKDSEEEKDSQVNLILKHFYKIDAPNKYKYDEIDLGPRGSNVERLGIGPCLSKSDVLRIGICNRLIIP